MLRFRIPLLPWAAALLLVFSPALLPVLMGFALFPGTFRGPGLGLLLVYLAALAYTRFVCVMDIDGEGMALYRVNRLRWPEVVAARSRRVLFLPYLVLERTRGMNWWVPLYFTGPVDVREALRRSVDPGHPIRSALG
ncbi:MAG TPA: hypothetical protein VF615_04335 [Longimicrobiaceae bacterium]|jgi:hypothetical protein